MAVGIIGGNVLGMGVLAITLAPAAVAANTSAEQVVTVPGGRPGDFVDPVVPGFVAGIGVAQARVTAANTVAMLFTNNTGGALTPPAGAYQFLVVRPEVPNAASFAP